LSGTACYTDWQTDQCRYNILIVYWAVLPVILTDKQNSADIMYWLFISGTACYTDWQTEQCRYNVLIVYWAVLHVILTDRQNSADIMYW